MDEYSYTESTENFDYGYDSGDVIPVRYPGKEIAVLILGINSLVWAGLTVFCSWIPFYGLIFLGVWGGIALACIIVCNKMYNTVKLNATETTSKLETGKKLNKIGTIILIVDAALAALSIIICILLVILGVGASYF